MQTDSLSQLISLAQISGSINTLCQFQGEWYVHHPRKRAHGMIHFVAEGEGWLQIANHAPQKMRQGHVIVLPRSIEHTLSSHVQCNNTQATIHVTDYGAFQLKSAGTGNNQLTLFCANFDYDTHADLFNGLPEVLFLNQKDIEFNAILSLLQQESQTPQAASDYLLSALLQIALIHILRHCIEARLPLSGVLNGLHDVRLREMMTAVLSHPEENWTVAHMMAYVGLSRAQFMRIFKQNVGMSPHAFVNHVRLQVAAKMLRETTHPIMQIACATGFQSETHFGKAFKKQYEISPGAYRQKQKVRNL